MVNYKNYKINNPFSVVVVHSKGICILLPEALLASRLRCIGVTILDSVENCGSGLVKYFRLSKISSSVKLGFRIIVSIKTQGKYVNDSHPRRKRVGSDA